MGSAPAICAVRLSSQPAHRNLPSSSFMGETPDCQMLSPSKIKSIVNLKEYGSDLAVKMSQAWDLAITIGIRSYQTLLKVIGCSSFKPAEKTGKLARAYHGPYRIIELETNTARIRRIDKPNEDPMLVALDRLRRCPNRGILATRQA